MGQSKAGKSVNYLLIKKVNQLTDVNSSGRRVDGASLKYSGSDWSFQKESNGGYVGEIAVSPLTESEFQGQKGSDWVLADGRNIQGSELSKIRGSETCPDLRGVFLKGKDNGRSLSDERSLGSYTSDKTKTPNNPFTTNSNGLHNHSASLNSAGAHTHYVAYGGYQSYSDDSNWLGERIVNHATSSFISEGVQSGGLSSQSYRMAVDTQGASNVANAGYSEYNGSHLHPISTTNSGSHTHTISGGDTETSPKNITLNHFIKIN